MLQPDSQDSQNYGIIHGVIIGEGGKMAETIKRVLKQFTGTFSFPVDLFSLGPGEPRFEPSVYVYPSAEEAWRQDWENIGGDFRRAVSRFERELTTA